MLNAVFSLAIASCLPMTDASVEASKAKPIPKAEFTNAGHTVDDVEEVKEFVKNKRAVLLDVRERDEWNAGHLKLARLVPLSEIRKGDLSDKLAKRFPKDKPIYLHCQSGGRVLMVAEILKSKGYDLRPLRPGYKKLLEGGFEKAEPKSQKKAKDQNDSGK